MLNSCRKFVWMKICYWKFAGNLNTHVPLWAQQYMVDRHYSLNWKPSSARTLCVYAHADLAQKYSVDLQEIFVSRLCSQEENSFFLPCLSQPSLSTFPVWGNRSTRRKPTTFGRALTDSSHESVARVESTISEVKCACSADDCATEDTKETTKL
jgi:hypothetical protein